MRARQLVATTSALLLLSACNLGQAPTAADDSDVATAVAQTLAAQEAGEQTEAPTASEVPATASPTPETGATAAPTEQGGPTCEVVTGGLNLRYGPGVVYAPPLSVLDRGTQMQPRARNPAGTWVEIVVTGTQQTGWVSSGEQFIACDVDVSGLPVGVVPPTPTPSPTPPVLVVGAIEGTVDVTVQDRVRLEISAHDPNVGDQNGDGISHVEFLLSFEGRVVYGNIDTAPPYCAVPEYPVDDRCFYHFFPEEPVGPPVWPNGTEIQDGTYLVTAVVHGAEEIIETVQAEFTVELP